ncbi:MAG: thioredoxin [Bacteroidales bacterium]|nr:thioredoxin [Bacteroidales bacterium]
MQANFNTLIQSNTPVLVDFYADWCAPCKMMTPVLKQLKENLGDKIKIIKINVDANPEISARYQIRSIPATMLFKNGQVKWSGVGVLPAHQLQHSIIQHIEIN